MFGSRASAGVPSGTDTEEWRVMSASIAHALWSNPMRAQQRSEKAGVWADVATDYRAMVRFVLRQMVKEGITFQTGAPADAGDKLPQAWWEKSARMAWLLWLRQRREIHGADEATEAMFWGTDSASYRDYVRSALRNLRAQGIHLAH